MEVIDSDSEEDVAGSIIDQLGLIPLYSRDFKGLAEHFFYDPELQVPLHIVLVGFSRLKERCPELAAKLGEYLDLAKSSCEELEGRTITYELK